MFTTIAHGFNFKKDSKLFISILEEKLCLYVGNYNNFYLLIILSSFKFRRVFPKPNNHVYTYTAQKMKFSIKDFSSKCDQTAKAADLVTFTGEILNGTLHFLCCDIKLMREPPLLHHAVIIK